MPAAVVEIPFSWIATPLTRKPTTAITKAQITQAGAATAYASGTDAQVRQYGANVAPITLNTDCSADPQNLADFLIAYQVVPRPLQPSMTFNLLDARRSNAEILTILGIGLAQRIRITDGPIGTPPGALNFTVQGIAHRIAVEERTVTWYTSALIGASATTPGPWFRWDVSSWNGTDKRPF